MFFAGGSACVFDLFCFGSMLPLLKAPSPPDADGMEGKGKARQVSCRANDLCQRIYLDFDVTIVPATVPTLSLVVSLVHVTNRSRVKLPLAPAKRPVPPTMVWFSTTCPAGSPNAVISVEKLSPLAAVNSADPTPLGTSNSYV